ncbi:helix-turn-helix domain-containing protein [Vagococcus entomophilus]|uniref:Helicase Helix-turn-helix domain-containing protein n=1 Tax=Vagococcus entomophilus TaxID=1160095 RepID=A0A430AJ38_9ENTE|nr:helix-turn-helix domain-containing protein [Vagococcus entomophilus]RSU08105.1 hypothetical protein CBF30_02345 [Vagococcus entomophilus]
MNFDDNYILSLFRHGYKVRWTTLLHLLQGKKTASILSYGALYGYLPLYGVLPQLKKQELIKQLRHLEKEKLLCVEDSFVQICSQFPLPIELQEQFVFPHISGLECAKEAPLFWNRALFATQVLSELTHHNNQYRPLETQFLIQQKLKAWLKIKPYTLDEKSQLLYQEWLKFINHHLNKKEAEFLVDHFSGYQKVGRTQQQFQMSTLQYHLIVTDIQHLFFKKIAQNEGDYPLLHSLMRYFQLNNGLQTIDESVILFQSGRQIAEIARAKKIKVNTVKDHLLEYGCCDKNFDFSELLPHAKKATFEEFEKHHRDIRLWDYRQLQQFDSTLDYYDWRFYQLMRIRGQ